MTSGVFLAVFVVCASLVVLAGVMLAAIGAYRDALAVALVFVLMLLCTAAGCSPPPPANPRPACQLAAYPPVARGDELVTDDELEALVAWSWRAWDACAPLGVDAPYPPQPLVDEAGDGEESDE